MLWWRLAERLEDGALTQQNGAGLGPAEAEELSEEAREMLASALRHAGGLPRIRKMRAQRQLLAEGSKGGLAFRQRRVFASDRDAGDAENQK